MAKFGTVPLGHRVPPLNVLFDNHVKVFTLTVAPVTVDFFASGLHTRSAVALFLPRR